MATVIIAKNNTGSDISIEDLGVTILGAGQRVLTDVFEVIDIANSDDLDTEVNAGNITINDGSVDLSISNAIKHINLQTEYEDQHLTAAHARRYSFFIS